MIHIVADRATPQQIKEMLAELKTYIKLTVDVKREIIAGGGALHADCEAALIEDGSDQTDIWGADWFPDSQEIQFVSLINIRPKQGNRSMTVSDPALQAVMERIIRAQLS